MLRLPIAATILAALGAAVTAALWVRSVATSELLLPKPRGPFAVGRSVFDWIDAARNRELMVFVWYPAPAASQGVPAEHLPGKWGDLAKPRLPAGEVHSSSLQDAPVIEGRHPLLVLVPGMGNIPTDYSTIAEDLASFGYVIAGVAPTGSARVVVFPSGRVVRGTDGIDLEHRVEQQPVVARWLADCRFVLDQLPREGDWGDRIDWKRIGIFGHSFGGAVTLHALKEDRRFLRGADLDGAPHGAAVTNLDRPVLFLNGSPLPPSQRGLNDKILAEMQAICSSAKVGCEWKGYPEAGHANFSDRGALPLPWPLPRSRYGLTEIDGTAFLRKVSSDLKTFFDRL